MGRLWFWSFLWSLQSSRLAASFGLAPAKIQRANGYSMVSWNLLAPSFATPEKYHFCDPEHLDWNFRRRAILEKLESVSADVICLQEVELDTWEKDFLSHFEPRGYSGVMQKVTKGHPIGCAVLVRDACFRVLREESRSRALIVVLEEVKTAYNKASNKLFLANVHLEAGLNQDEKRFCQVHSLLKRLRKQVLLTTAQSSPETDPFIVIAGDFNMLHSNPVHHLLSTGAWIPENAKQTTSKAFVGSKRASVTASVETKDIPLQQQMFPFLPMRELYQTSSSRNTMGMTFSGGTVLDYIWVSESAHWKHATPWVVDDSVLHPHTRQPWPSAENPSDHIMIGAFFDFQSGGFD